MNRDTLLALYDRLTHLVEKLPGGVQKPILKELTPIRQVFLDQRPARLMLIGATGPSVPALFHAIGAVNVETGESDSGWRTYRLAGRGEVLVLDARLDTPTTLVASALARAVPDVALYLGKATELEASLKAGWERLEKSGPNTPLIGIVFAGEAERAGLEMQIHADSKLSTRTGSIWSPEMAAEAICAILPDAARLEFARILGAKIAQAQIAGSLLKSFTTVCGVIGLQPIPLADMPVLTALQALMAALIVYVSGKQVSARLVTEFVGALGLNIGAGMLFREGARALIKFVPLWGNAVSGFVAGAGTYALGRAAIAYFIEETPIAETRKIFNRLLPGLKSFKLPSLPGRKKDQPPALPKG